MEMDPLLSGTFRPTVTRFLLPQVAHIRSRDRANETRHSYLKQIEIVVLEPSMPCPQMKELVAHFHRYSERPHTKIPSAPERSSETTGALPVGEFRIAYLMQLHRQNCDACRNESLGSLLKRA
jgi:hypothetical protein